MSKAVAIVSGGLDSVTLAYMLHSQGAELHLLSFDYGQRHRKELDCARRCAERLGAAWDLVDLTYVGRLMTGSALTDPSIAVPDGHYADPTMQITIVPNRNAVFLAVAYSVAAAQGADMVAIGVHGGDHPIYPDCRPAFINAFSAMQDLALEGYADPLPRLYTPFLEWTKADIVRQGASWGVPFEDTWSCYKGGDIHCGTCGTCVERREAFQVAGIEDPTKYAATAQ
jgi:7-cyano-7-deazaguanine synthase